MIIRANKEFEVNSVFPSSDWYEEGNLIIDETTEQGQQMAQTYSNNYPFVDFEHDGGFVTQVIVLDKPERPEEVDGKEVVLEQNEQGVWGYTYKDKPLSELELLRQQVEQQQELIDTMLGVIE